MLIFLIICLLPRVMAITVISMKESLEAFNKPSGARVRNLNLTDLSEVTLCLRVFFYQFPISTYHDLKWFTILGSTGSSSPSSPRDHDLLFSVIVDKTSNSTTQRSNYVTEMDQNKDLKAYAVIRGAFIKISNVNPFHIRTWNDVCIYGRKIYPKYEVFINGKILLSINDFPEELSNSLLVFRHHFLRYKFTTYGKFTDLNVYDKMLSLDDVISWTKQQPIKTEALLNWNEVEVNLELENLERIEFQRINFTENIDTLFIFHEHTFNEAVRRCQSVGGAIATPFENINLDVWENKVWADRQVDRMWLGYRINEFRSNFSNIYKIRKNNIDRTNLKFIDK